MAASTSSTNTDNATYLPIAEDDWTDVPHDQRKKRDRYLSNEELRPLLVKSDYRAARHIAGTLVFAALSGWTVLKCPWWMLPIAWFIHGFILQCYSYCGQHETMHYTAFKTRILNEIVAFICSLICFEFAAHERVMHKQHHIYPNDPKRDPEISSFWSHIAHIPGFRKCPATKQEYWMEFFDLPSFLKSHACRLVNCALGTPVDYTGTGWSLAIPAESVRRHLQEQAILQLIVYAIGIPLLVLTFGWWNILKVWIIPAIIGVIPITFTRIAEHSSTSNDLNGLTNTRSNETHPLIQFLMWNMNLHADHHLYTSVPFYHLPALHKLVSPQLKCVDKGFLESNWLMYTVWIPAQAAAIAKYQHEQSQTAR